jgi:hypothetical protein
LSEKIGDLFSDKHCPTIVAFVAFEQKWIAQGADFIWKQHKFAQQWPHLTGLSCAEIEVAALA